MKHAFEKVIEPKYLEYQFEEIVLLRLDSYYSQGGLLQQNGRAYFDPSSIVTGRRVIGIELFCPAGTVLYEGVQILTTGGTAIQRFCLTLVDEHGDEIIKDYPIFNLEKTNTFGQIRVFDVIPVIDKCYILNTGAPIAQANRGLLFNFYTVNW